MSRAAAAAAVLLVGSSGIGCGGASHRATPQPRLSGPASAEIPLYRASPDGERIYVEADLGDGVPRFFMVDTGASVTTLTAEVAEELGLTTRDSGNWLVGLGGRTAWIQADVDELRLGAFTLNNVEVAVGVQGVPDTAGVVPLAGLMGNNVWQNFTVGLDYPGGVMELYRPGALELPATAQPMIFDSQHIIVSVALETRPPDGAEVDGDGAVTEAPVHQTVEVLVDTGAGGLLLSGVTAPALEAVTTTGVEPIFGVGSGDDLPVSNFLHQTRRVPVQSVTFGGARVEEDLTATWIDASRGLGSLLGHTVLDEHRVLIDYTSQRIALVPSTRAPATPDIHTRYLAWFQQTRPLLRPMSEEDLLQLVSIRAYQDDLSEAQRLLERHLRRHPDDAQAQVMLAQIVRHNGDPERALQTLQALPVPALVTSGAVLQLVNGLWLEGQTEAALTLGEAAVTAAPEESIAWLALADARRASGDLEGARRALLEVNRLEQNPDGHLLRRAWIASEEEDHFAVLTHIRRLLQLYPNGNYAPWFYALEARDTAQVPLFVDDLTRARARLHPGDGPLDFMAGAYFVVGMTDLASHLMAEGIRRDCASMDDADNRANCEAWYHALTGTELEQAHARIASVVDAHPHRSEYLDTLAVVEEARGDLAAARDAAWRAARLEPDDVYLLWQAARFSRALQPGR